MAQLPNLTVEQKSDLAILEPKLRKAAEAGNYELAKDIVISIQEILRPTGHETRLMQAKNWLFQAAMEVGNLEMAISGFIGVRSKVSPKTRVWVEATALLAICYLRKLRIDQAQPLMAQAIRGISNIKSAKQLWQFKRRLIQRFEEEYILATIVNEISVPLDTDKIQDEAGKLIQTHTEDEILAKLAETLPRETINTLLYMHVFALKQLPSHEQQLLPDSKQIVEKATMGRMLLSAIHRVLWRSLCDPTSDVYKMWFESGMKLVVDKKVISFAIGSALVGMKIGYYALAISATAMIFKMGLEVFCEISYPQGLMMNPNEKK